MLEGADPVCLSSRLDRIPSIMLRSFRHLVCTYFVLWVYLADTIAAIKITGATGGVDLATGARPFRLEINTFATLGAPYDLFILALRQLQSTNQTNPLSYFQIAGIHGYPQQAWDSVVGTGQSTGYCMHFCPVFSTWHRPYMALYEVSVLRTNPCLYLLMVLPPASYMEQCTSHCAHLPNRFARRIHIRCQKFANSILGLGSISVSTRRRNPTKCDYHDTKWPSDLQQSYLCIHLPGHA
jgi:hypothetical protein